MQSVSEPSKAASPKDYLFAGNPQDPATWFLRIRNEAGELDYKLMELAKAKIRDGFQREIFEADFAQWAFKRLRELYDKPDTKNTEHGNEN